MMSDTTEATNRVLILFAHPALQKSRINRAMINEIIGLDGVTFHDLYEAYPEFDIDIDAEQEIMEEHDIIVFQHPLFWYSSPAIIKEWLDMVLEHDWAYGHNGTALHGKKLMQAVSTGGGESTYARDGVNKYTIKELLAPFEMTAMLCGMEYLPPFAIHGTHALGMDDVKPLAVEYKRTITALRDNAIDFKKAKQFKRLNSDLDAIIKPGAVRS